MLALLPALVLDGLLVAGLVAMLDGMVDDDAPDRPRPVRLVLIEKPPEPEKEEEEEEEEPELDGQIVEVAPPLEEEKPKESDYLAEHDQVVEEETKVEKVTVNPELLAKTHSEEQQVQTEDLIDLNVMEESTGARVGNDRFDPDRDGALASLPSPWAVTNKDGLQKPTIASHANAALAGSVQNDLIDERSSDELNLNTKKYLYAGYINRIRRVVNFYWNQELDNLPSSVRFSKNRYTTVVNVVLDADGALEIIEVTTPSGSEPLDEAVVSAFKLGSPFPHPPEGLVEKDGRVYLPDFGFDVNLGVAQNRYQGIDPRAGVKFPGILKSPR
ncbi:MAG: TonB family protein [Alphaproteobacteria bacterium]|nr:TonB family protein [Alphaproteobacteria bacterium]MCB9690380.1 TonB family protein [Alphaproteobacteria bacterium]